MKALRSRHYLPGHLLNPLTPYVPAAQTDIALTFRRVRELQALEAERKRWREGEALIEKTPNVVRLK